MNEVIDLIEQKILDIPRTNPTVVSGQVVTPSMDQNEVDALYNVLAEKNVFSKFLKLVA